MDEISEITDYVIASASKKTTLIWGMGHDQSLEEKIGVTVIATGFQMNNIMDVYVDKKHLDYVPLRDNTEKQNAKGTMINPFQQQFEFDDPGSDGKAEEYVLYDQLADKRKSEEKEHKLAERVRSLKETHERLKERGYTPQSKDDEIDELENIPAYIRKKLKMDPGKHSDSEEVSRYRLSEDESKSPKLRQDNSYLHDNVD